ncbi:Fe-S-containing protein [Propionicimonas sp.]|uniref:Fe-S-containing protein n=1 Tax=Propionicimonas sp. TaxID=1955623 RepID=UPI0039E3EB75
MLSLFVEAIIAAVPPALAWLGLFAGRRRLDSGRPGGFLLATTAGVAAAAAIASLELTTDWISREVLALWLLPLLVLLAGAGVVWTWWPRTSDGRGPAWGRASLAVLAALVCVVGLPDLFSLAAAVVPYGASPFTTDALGNLGGSVLGSAVVAVTGWALYRGATGAPARAVRLATCLVLLFVGLDHLVTLTRTLVVRGLVDPSPWLFGVVVVAVNNQWMLTAGIAIACLIPVGSALVAPRASRTVPANPAQARLHRASVLTRRRFLGLSSLGVGVVVAALTLGRSVADAEPTLSAPEALAGDEESVWVEIAAIDDGHLHRFAYPAQDGTEVRFIAIRKSTASYVAALDACAICGPAGYYEQDGRVICKMCGVAMNIATIGFAGGCNPIPIDYTVGDGRLSVARTVLDANAQVFE